MSLPPTNYLIHVSTIKCKCAGNYTRHYGHFLHAKYRKNPLLQKMCTLEGDFKKKTFL